MNITWSARRKRDDVLNLKQDINAPEKINYNFDTLSRDGEINKAAIQAYLIDLTKDTNSTTRLPLLDLFGTGAGLTTNFLRQDGSWQPPPLPANSVNPYGPMRWGGINQANSGSGPTGVGMSAGSYSNFGSTIQFNQAGIIGIGTTGAASGNSVEGSQGASMTTGNQNPYGRWYIQTQASVANIRLWCAFASGNLNSLDSPTSTRTIGFRFSTGAGDTGWVGLATNSAGGSPQVTSTIGSAIAANTEYLLEAAVSTGGAGNVAGGSVKFTVTPYLNGLTTGAASSATLDTSASVITVAQDIHVAVTTLTTAARSFGLKSIYWTAV